MMKKLYKKWIEALKEKNRVARENKLAYHKFFEGEIDMIDQPTQPTDSLTVQELLSMLKRPQLKDSEITISSDGRIRISPVPFKRFEGGEVFHTESMFAEYCSILLTPKNKNVVNDLKNIIAGQSE